MAAHKHGPGEPDFRERAKKLVESWRQRAEDDDPYPEQFDIGGAAMLRSLADELEKALKP